VKGSLLLTAGLALPSIILALPAIVDTLAWIAGLIRHRPRLPELPQIRQPVVFLVPAHDESLLIDRCVRSLLGQEYPRSLLSVVVVADNCTDDTAARALAAGAQVLERTDQRERGKGHAIGWALHRLPLDKYAAVIIVDADTIVDPGYTNALMAFAPLDQRAMQTFDGASNEFETWLTRMAGLLTRNRYDIVLPLKTRAGLNCPMTGDGVVLGTAVLSKHPWRVATITEGWEFYARLTLAGVHIDYVPRARLYAQETRAMSESGTQRQRWTAGRLAVLGLYWKKILSQRGIGALQRFDLLAELTSLGPVVRGVFGLAGAAITLMLSPPGAMVIVTLYAAAVFQQAGYSLVSLRRHPEPGPTLLAFLRLPFYAVWRVGVGLRAFLATGRGRWVRTARQNEP
jgi:cellulose synthase/poly-beta-1,6-N-acetylglucosamine synthase-like glycosyltransferase